MLLYISLFAFVLSGCCSKNDNTTQTNNTDTEHIEEKNTALKEEYLDGLHHIEIEIKNYGTISLELDADTALITVTNFINLAKESFYDGLMFHRIINEFMIQGGDPLENGIGGSDKNIKGEFNGKI